MSITAYRARGTSVSRTCSMLRGSYSVSGRGASGAVAAAFAFPVRASIADALRKLDPTACSQSRRLVIKSLQLQFHSAQLPVAARYLRYLLPHVISLAQNK